MKPLSGAVGTHADPALGLAESWEQTTPTTLRFRLRQGVKFHNGDDCDAEAIKVSAASYAAPESRSSLKSSLAVVREVKVVDKYTVNYVATMPTVRCCAPSVLRRRCLHVPCRNWVPRLPPTPLGLVPTSLSSMSLVNTC